MSIHREVSLGRILGPFEAPPFPFIAISPLGLVPKKDSGEFRLIHDLSYPKQHSVNSGIPSTSTAVQYEILDHAIDLIVRASPGALIAKADIESAYRIVPIHSDSIPLLGMTCDGLYYFDAFLPFGLSQSCAIFEAFSTAVQWCLKRISPLTSVTHILDDFIFIGSCDSATSLGLQAFFNLAQELASQ